MQTYINCIVVLLELQELVFVSISCLKLKRSKGLNSDRDIFIASLRRWVDHYTATPCCVFVSSSTSISIVVIGSIRYVFGGGRWELWTGVWSAPSSPFHLHQRDPWAVPRWTDFQGKSTTLWSGLAVTQILTPENCTVQIDLWEAMYSYIVCVHDKWHWLVGSVPVELVT